MISVHFQGKPFNIIVYAPTSNAEEAKAERFNEDLQELLELTPKKMSFWGCKESDTTEHLSPMWK